MDATERTLTRRELNRAVLARQMLLTRSRTTLPRALERICGVQSQYAPSMYVALWSRLEGFERRDLTDALERRSVVQGTLMRSTIHLVSRRDYWPFAVAIRGARRQWWLRVTRGNADEIVAASERARARLSNGPVSRAELERVVGRNHMAGIGLWVDMVRVPPSGTWERRRADLFASAERWIGPEDVSSEDDAARHLVARYLRGFGPASRKDIAAFTGLAPRAVSACVARVAPRRFRDDDGTELVDVPRGEVPPADIPAPVRFLPTWDATLLAHARRSGILPERYRPRVFHTRTPQSVCTFLVDGVVAGTWKYEAGRVLTEPFERLPRAATHAVREEADRLAEMHG